MIKPFRRRPLALAVIAGATLTLIVPTPAFAHAELSPKASLSGRVQLYSLAVPTEKENATTTRVVLTVPSGFSIESFVPSPGWRRTAQQSGSGESAVIQKVTWTGGKTPTGEDSVFEFLAQPASAKTYTFQVQQTYSDGLIVNWRGSESSDSPAPTLDVVSSLNGGGSSVLAIIALIVGALGLLAGCLALVSRRAGDRTLA